MHSIKINLDVVLNKRGMTLNELSEKTGVSIANLSNLKNNRVVSVRFSTLGRICKALECQPADILKYEDD
ncbi:transcriptional regulator, XRE family (plasmid) [Phocaeicola salanitronis DSM 18170]|jgi:putative transcriptional regulator|uniref:Transcriptional regulator, XRE family n=1 Tax=Phocaeicola salanitronis (strain DSM 18170 / JCM 13657 / CCUG 60908 / BL78) TaxID=667015 RepID=F0R9C4_PHOSB|nr:helix-turn-helix transcriptional regulator [Phocaeicola salanitronis]ADY38245.1 transcriptional regulator, XRE family [Phocaeicola salanitronis DSM 18170]